jgi:hypothetical protein
MVLARRGHSASILRRPAIVVESWNSTGLNLARGQQEVAHRTANALPDPKKRFIGPISKSLLKKRKNAGILLVSLAKNKWISSPNGDPNGNPAWLSRSTF